MKLPKKLLTFPLQFYRKSTGKLWEKLALFKIKANVMQDMPFVQQVWLKASTYYKIKT